MLDVLLLTHRGRPRRHSPFVREVVGKEAGEGLTATTSYLFGRKTYEKMAAHWPHEPDENPIAAHLNATPKYVVTSTLTSLDWAGSHVLDGDVVDSVNKLKAQGDGTCAGEPHARFDAAAGGNQASRQVRAAQAPPADPTATHLHARSSWRNASRSAAARPPGCCVCSRPAASAIAVASAQQTIGPGPTPFGLLAVGCSGPVRGHVRQLSTPIACLRLGALTSFCT